MPFAKVILPIDVAATDLMTIEDALRALPGVKRVYVSRAVEMAYVVYDPARWNAGTLEEAVRNVQVPLPAAALAENVVSPAPAAGGDLWATLGQVLRRFPGHPRR